MAKRRLLKRKTLTVRVTVPVLEKLTRWAKQDGIDRAEFVRLLIDREAEIRGDREDREVAERMAAAHLDRIARMNAEMAA